MRGIGRLVVTGLALVLVAASADAKEGGNPVVVMSTSRGEIKLVLDKEKAPIAVENFVAYAKDGYYDGTIFHRVIPNFMIQGGGLDKDMNEKATTRAAIQNEAKSGLKNRKGTIAMARTSDPNSATSQFFINVQDNTSLDHRGEGAGYGYAVFGRVIEGMDVVETIENVKTGRRLPHQNVPVEAVIIESVRIVE